MCITMRLGQSYIKCECGIVFFIINYEKYKIGSLISIADHAVLVVELFQLAHHCQCSYWVEAMRGICLTLDEIDF